DRGEEPAAHPGEVAQLPDAIDDAGDARLLPWRDRARELLPGAVEYLQRPLDLLQLALAQDARDHLPHVGLRLEVLAAIAGPARAGHDAPPLQLVEGHRCRTARDLEAIAQLGGRERILGQVERGPDPAHGPLEAPE